MQYGLPISFALHSLAIFGGVFLYSGKIKPYTEGRVIPVDIISVADETNVRAALKAKMPEEIDDTDAPMRLENPLDNAPEEDAPEEALNQDIPQPEKIAEAVIPDTATTLDVPDTEDFTPQEPERVTFSLDNMAALIDQTRQAQPDKNQQQTLQSEVNRYEFATTARAGAGLETKLTLNELDALQSKMYKCGRISADAKNPEELVVRVRVRLNQDGSVRDANLLDKVQINTSPNPYLKVAAERALRAVSKCAPYDFLPADKYSTWKDMELNFRPEV